MREALEFLEILPRGQTLEIVFPDEIKQARPGEFGAVFAERVNRERGPLAVDFAGIEGKSVLAAQGGLEQGDARFRRRRGTIQFVGGDFGWQKDDPLEPELLEGVARQQEVPIVNGIKTASEEAERVGNHFDRGAVLWFSIVRIMPMNDAGQLLLVGVPGKTLDPGAAGLFRELRPGGFILFGRNIESPEQLRRLIDDLRAISETEPIITIDQEGGRVSRLRLIGAEPPNAQALRDHGSDACITRHGATTARLLRLFGFNLDLCPVLDISFDDEADNSLRGRCYGRSAEEVIHKAGLFNDALRAGGILSCGKHFPGYTCAGQDPHHELPVIERSREELEAHELAVFRALAGRVDSMMIGHITISGLEAGGPPASLSPFIIHDLLRGDLGFQGLVMTDDLDMGAILNHYGFEEMIRRGLAAGNDLLMICHRVELALEARKILEGLPEADRQPALERVARFKGSLAPPLPFSEEAFREIDAEILQLRIDVLGEERALEKSPEDGKRSPVEAY